MGAERAGLGGALDDGGELRATNSGHHSGRAHRSRTDADLDDVGAGVDELARAMGGDDVAGDDRRVGGDAAHRFDRAQRALLVAVGGVDDENVDAHVAERFGLDVGAGIRCRSVDPNGDGDHQPAIGIDGGPVDRRAQGPVAGHHADQPTLVVDHRGERSALGGERPEGGDGVDPVGDRHDLAADRRMKLRESVVAGGVALAEHAERSAAFVDDDNRAVRALVDEGERVPDRVVRRQRDRGLIDGMPALDVVDDGADDVEGDVLRQYGEAAPTGHRFSHPPAGHRRHVGDDNGERRADPVDRREVDVETRPDSGQARHHEHVVVREVVAGVGTDHAHGRSRLGRLQPMGVLMTESS